MRPASHLLGMIESVFHRLAVGRPSHVPRGRFLCPEKDRVSAGETRNRVPRGFVDTMTGG